MCRKLDLFDLLLFIGGIKDFDCLLDYFGSYIQIDDFFGCMWNVFINGKKLDLVSVIEIVGIIDCCFWFGQCVLGMCKNGGKCVDYWFDYVCECVDGFSGRNCE